MSPRARAVGVVGAIGVSSALMTGLAHADVRFVRASAPSNGNGLTWATAHRTLTAALAEAAGNAAIDQIWVAGGVYRPHANNRDVAFNLVSGVSVYGGFAGNETLLAQRNMAANPTTLSGDLAGNDAPGFGNRGDNSRHVVRATGLSSGRLDGFTVRGGNADFDGEDLMGGGGAYLLESSIIVQNCEFRDNIAGPVQPDIGGFGGGLLVRACPAAEVRDCVFFGNRGMSGGGMAIWHEDEDRIGHDTVVVVADCSFIANFSPSQTGGAMRVHAGDPLFNSSQGQVSIERCVFEDNAAEYYGAITEINTTDFSITDCRFFGNGSIVAGGAIGTIQTVGGNVLQPVRITRCEFDANRTGVGNFGGAAVYAEARAMVVTSCTFTRHQGGTVIRSGPVTGFSGGARPLDLRNSVVADNDSTGVFALNSPRLTVVSCTIARNVSSVGGGGLAGGIEASAALLEVSNTILWENRRGAIMDETAQIRSFSSAPVVNFCVVQGLTGGLGGTGNLGLDPLFVNAGLGDYRVAGGSPAIDAGSNVLAIAGVTSDVAGLPRFAEVAASPNTGVGSAPIIDIGAHEAAGVACRPDLTTGAVPGEPGYGVPNGLLNNDDFFYYLSQFAAGNLAVADLTTGAIAGTAGYGVPNGVVTNDDFFYYLTLFGQGC